jgi:hypothetical protein
MTTSLRWGLGVLATLSLQIGCCSIHVDYEGPHCGIKPGCSEPACPADTCVADGACTINGLGHVRHSFAALKNHAKHNLTCGSGCGEVYWDEHINEPPVCDPCGCDNEWVGECGHCKPWYAKLRDLWGYPYAAAHCANSGGFGPCTDCGHNSYGGQCSNCGHGIHAAKRQFSVPYAESYGVDGESNLVIASPESEAADTVPIRDPEAVPTPAKPKPMPSLLPGDAEASPSAPSNKESSGGKTARSKSASGQRITVAKMEPASTIPAKPASVRRKLTTQNR